MSRSPRKEHGTNEPPPTGRVQETSKGDATCPSTSQNPSCWHPSWLGNAAPPGRPLSPNDWLQNAGNSPHHYKTQDFELSGRATLGSLTLMLSAWAPFPSVFCFVSSCMSPRTVHFPVLNKSPQRPWKRSPFLQHLNLRCFHLRNRGRLDKELAGDLLERPLGYQY